MSAIRLDSITLRGIGSYFSGAALKIKPLTVLCGKNGSGKSTWLNAMRILERSQRKGLLPFQFCTNDSDLHNLELVNSLVRNLQSSDFVEDAAAHDAFGPLGTIGITCIATKNSCLFPGECADEMRHPAAALLCEGRFAAGTRFRLRVAHVDRGLYEDGYSQDFIELLVDDRYTLRMTRPAPTRRINDNDYRPSKYILECSRSFFDESSPLESEIVPLLDFYVSNAEPSEQRLLRPENSAVAPDKILAKCIRLIRSIVSETTAGFFYVSAVRDIHETLSLDESALAPSIDEFNRLSEGTLSTRHKILEESIQQFREHMLRPYRDELAARRNVGPHGEATFELFWRFVHNQMQDMAVPTGYSFNAFVSRWLDSLLQIRSEFHRVSGGSADPPALPKIPLCGFLRKTEADETVDRDPGIEFDPKDLTRFDHSCFVHSQGPPRFAAGFHQLMPLIVQAALLQRGEIMAVENPEVHLHPSLQIKISEFLMHQALGGKAIVVETHSDLILRRLIRAVLEEELAQELVGIHFISLKIQDGYTLASVMESLSVDGDGRIDNWPEGFLDDDIKESRRLFSIMYGTVPDENDEDSQ